jgi:predicted amidophosphoribosyltransferase
MKNIHLAYYRDEVGEELLLFKRDNFTAIDRWLHFVEQHFDSFFKDVKVDYVVRALSSNEVSYEGNTPLDFMGELLATKLNAQYVPQILTKNRTQALKSAGNKYRRKEILDKSYHCNLKDLKKNATYLIVDDVSTTGTTFNEIARSIVEASNQKAKTISFSLVKTLWDRDYTQTKIRYNQKFYRALTAEGN